MTDAFGGGPLNLPIGITTTDVFGRLLSSDGTACVGSIEWLAGDVVSYTVSDVTLIPKAIEVFLDPTGYFFVTLPASDDPAANPRGVPYSVSEKMPGGRKRTLLLTMTPALHDYADLVEVALPDQVVTAPTPTFVTINVINGGTP